MIHTGSGSGLPLMKLIFTIGTEFLALLGVNPLAFKPVLPIIAAIFRPNRSPKGVLARLDILRDLSGERPSKSDARGRVTAHFTDL